MKKKSKMRLELEPFWKVYYLPKENSEACNKELYEILESESPIYCLVGANDIHNVSSTASPLFTKQELYALLDMYVFLNKEKLLPFTQLPNKKYIHTLFNTLFPDIYEQLVKPTNEDNKETKVFETLIPLLEDPRKLNLTKENTLIEKEKLIELLNKKKISIIDKKDGNDFFSGVIANMNNNIKIILKIFDDYNITSKSQEKKLNKIKLCLEMLKIEHKDSPELAKLCNDHKELLSEDIANTPKQADLFEPIWHSNFDWDTRRLYDIYTNESINADSKFSIDMRNLLYDEWKSTTTKKTVVDMENIMLQMFGLENTSENTITLYKYIEHDIPTQSEIFEHMGENISLYSDEVERIVFESIYTVFLDNILLSVDEGDFDWFFIEAIPNGLLLDSIYLYFATNQEVSSNKAVMNRNKYIFNNNKKNIEYYIESTKSLELLISLEKLICHKYNGLSVEKAVSIYAQNNIYKDFVPEALSAVNMATIFGVCLSHLTGASVNSVLPALKRQFSKSKKAYDEIVSYEPAFDVWRLILLPAKENLVYFVWSNKLDFYLEQLVIFNDFVFSEDGLEEDVSSLILSAICNSFKWVYFENQSWFEEVYTALVSSPTKAYVIAQECISKIILNGWRQEFREEFVTKTERELKWIVFNSDILSLSQFDEGVETELNDVESGLFCILFGLGVLTTQKLALIYTQIKDHVGNSWRQELYDICKKTIPGFTEETHEISANANQSIENMFKRQDLVVELNQLTEMQKTPDILNKISEIESEIQELQIEDTFDMEME